MVNYEVSEMQTASHHLNVETGPEVLGYFSDIPVNLYSLTLIHHQDIICCVAVLPEGGRPFAPPCGVSVHTPQSSLLGALHLTPAGDQECPQNS
jgi:hypothetical protein